MLDLFDLMRKIRKQKLHTSEFEKKNDITNDQINNDVKSKEVKRYADFKLIKEIDDLYLNKIQSNVNDKNRTLERIKDDILTDYDNIINSITKVSSIINLLRCENVYLKYYIL